MWLLTKATYWNDGLKWEHWIGFLSAVVTVLAVALGAYLTYRFAVRQLRHAHHQAIRQQRQVHRLAVQQDKLGHNIAVRSDRLRREIAALEAVWELLEYMTQRKNDKAIIRWRTERDEKGRKTKTYFFHHDNLEEFMFSKISEVFYRKHAGLFISAAVRDLVNGYRSVAGEFYFAHQRSKLDVPEDGLIAVKSAAKAVELAGIYDELNALLRAELQERYAALEV